MALMLPFPAVHRRDFIRRNAYHAAGYKLASGERVLSSLIERHRARLERIGVDPEMAEADTAALETAIRVEMAALQSRFRA